MSRRIKHALYIWRNWKYLRRHALKMCDLVERFGGFRNLDGSFNPAQRVNDPEIAEHWAEFWELDRKICRLVAKAPIGDDGKV